MHKRSTLLLLTAGLALAGCSPIVATRGNLTDTQRLSEIQPGSTSRDQVQYLLGYPTATGTVDPNVWYYIGRRTEQTAFFQPDVVEQRIVRIRFDGNGTVAALDEIDGNAARAIDPSEATTPTVGHDMSFLEQLVGNLNRPTRKKKDDDKKKGGRR
ncbi:outer membrane protein assembly factor BamE [Rhodospirillum centenum]|uniref:SmpA n=1 Tax=Rhodospirillum centenum (strain ATCC 51521 / SW) TaxID=414684 RepID=B6IMS0_RHOCS|nr:outer membrane protein assembly factor BamE [Rhodospirillum centenum]ACI98736.1 SmpA [Rhodospirillum centenum SW]